MVVGVVELADCVGTGVIEVTGEDVVLGAVGTLAMVPPAVMVGGLTVTVVWAVVVPR